MCLEGDVFDTCFHITIEQSRNHHAAQSVGVLRLIVKEVSGYENLDDGQNVISAIHPEDRDCELATGDEFLNKERSKFLKHRRENRDEFIGGVNSLYADTGPLTLRLYYNR